MSTLYARQRIWRLSFYCAPGCPAHPTGHRQHCVSLHTKDAKAARALQQEFDKQLQLKKARAALGLVTPAPAEPWTLEQFLTRYEEKVLAEQLVSPNTFARTERYALQGLLAFRPQARLSELTVELVRAYQTVAKAQVAPATWNSRRGTLKAIGNRALAWGWLPTNPFLALDRAKAIKRRPKRLFQEQLPEILRAASPFWRLFSLFLYATGVRMGEACNLQRAHIRWQQGYLEIETNKENEPKLIALTPPLTRLLKAALSTSASKDYVFSVSGDRLKEETVKSAYDRLSQVVGYRVSAHRFRHSHGTHVLEHGGNIKTVQVQLGHADIRTTADYYLHVDLEEQRRSMALLPVDDLLQTLTKP